jgi:hypothetical protein
MELHLKTAKFGVPATEVKEYLRKLIPGFDSLPQDIQKKMLFSFFLGVISETEGRLPPEGSVHYAG